VDDIHPSGAWDADDLDVGRILEPHGACKVRRRIGTPLTAKGHDGRFVFFHFELPHP